MMHVPDLRSVDDSKHRFNRFRSPTVNFVNVLRLVWILALLHGEFIIFWKAAYQCAPWPSSVNNNEQVKCHVACPSTALGLTPKVYYRCWIGCCWLAIPR